MIERPRISSACDDLSHYSFARRYSGYIESERDRKARIWKRINTLVITVALVGLFGLVMWSTSAALPDEQLNGSPKQTMRNR